jgi:hypothetical protein
VAIAEKVTAIPACSGRVVRANDFPCRAKTKGNTGRMHGLMIVSAPPRMRAEPAASAPPSVLDLSGHQLIGGRLVDGASTARRPRSQAEGVLQRPQGSYLRER